MQIMKMDSDLIASYQEQSKDSEMEFCPNIGRFSYGNLLVWGEKFW